MLYFASVSGFVKQLGAHRHLLHGTVNIHKHSNVMGMVHSALVEP